MIAFESSTEDIKYWGKKDNGQQYVMMLLIKRQ